MEEMNIFDDILDEGEKIITVVRPNKRKFWAFFNWMMFWGVDFTLVFMAAFMPIVFFVDPDISTTWAWIATGITFGSVVVISLLSRLVGWIFARAALRKRYYAYSNKRILIRCGIIGVDYKVLDYKLLGATTVTVGVLDRMLGGKTGWLRFGSASSPIGMMNSMQWPAMSGGFVFAHIDKPYDLLKEIKKTMHEAEKK